MVRMPIIVAGVTVNPTSAYRPIVMTRSWPSASNAATDIFESRK